MRATFPKSEKLCGSLTIDHLYKAGKRFVAWPLRVTYQPIQESQNQVLIWAPKSLFKKAVDRNYLRRLMREAYRLNKHLMEESEVHVMVALNYVDKQKQSYQVIDKAMRKALSRINKELAQSE